MDLPDATFVPNQGDHHVNPEPNTVATNTTGVPACTIRSDSAIPVSLSSLEKDDQGSDAVSTDVYHLNNQFGRGVNRPLPALPHVSSRMKLENGAPRRPTTGYTNRSDIEWIVPVEEKVAILP